MRFSPVAMGGLAAHLIAIIAGLALLTAHAAPAVRADEAAYRRAVEADFQRWLNALRPDAEAQGVTRATFDQALGDVRLDWSLPDLRLPDLGPGRPAPPPAAHAEQHRPQAEFAIPANYFPEAGLARLTAIGRSHAVRWRDVLDRIEREFGVEGHVVLAVWGRETAFGTARLPHNAVTAIATQAFMGRRKDQFRHELLLALRILQEGHVRRDAMASSWAGAMGHTQFLPSDFFRHAVDFDGDGRRDIWNSVPDALASAANSLRHSGWETGKTWGYEIRLPDGFDCTLEGPRHARPVRDWAALGVTRAFDRAFPAERMAEEAFLVLPAGLRGPAFLALRNFMVLKSYNFADLYAIYVGHLADRIAFDSRFEGSWQPVSRFNRNEVRALQEHMAALAIDIGDIDGLLGHRTRASSGAMQRKLGLPMDCYPSRELLAHARAASKAAR